MNFLWIFPWKNLLKRLKENSISVLHLSLNTNCLFTRPPRKLKKIKASVFPVEEFLCERKEMMWCFYATSFHVSPVCVWHRRGAFPQSCHRGPSSYRTPGSGGWADGKWPRVGPSEPQACCHSRAGPSCWWGRCCTLQEGRGGMEEEGQEVESISMREHDKKGRINAKKMRGDAKTRTKNKLREKW